VRGAGKTGGGWQVAGGGKTRLAGRSVR
jgi:hypothetical protein